MYLQVAALSAFSALAQTGQPALEQYLAGDTDGAMRSLKAGAGANPAFSNLRVGLEQLQSGHAELAVQTLGDALAQDPANQSLRQVLADALYQAGHFQGAAAELIKVTDALPDNPRAWYVLGRTWSALSKGSYGEIVQKAPPDTAFVLAARADSMAQLRRYGQALIAYRQALEQDPNLITVHRSIAELYRESGRPDWAGREEERVRDFDCSSRTLACLAQGEKYEELLAATLRGQTIEDLYWRLQAYTGLADRAFRKLGSLPESAELHRYRAGLAYEAGQRVVVVNELRRASELAPHDRGLRRDLAMALGGAANYGEAWRAAFELLRQEPESPALNALAGVALLNDQRAEEAIPFLRKALRADAHNFSLEASLGRALLETGKPQLALPYLLESATGDKDGSVHFQLAQAYRRTAQPEMARAALSEYRKLSTQPAAEPDPPLTAPE